MYKASETITLDELFTIKIFAAFVACQDCFIYA